MSPSKKKGGRKKFWKVGEKIANRMHIFCGGRGGEWVGDVVMVLPSTFSIFSHFFLHDFASLSLKKKANLHRRWKRRRRRKDIGGKRLKWPLPLLPLPPLQSSTNPPTLRCVGLGNENKVRLSLTLFRYGIKKVWFFLPGKLGFPLSLSPGSLAV